MSWKLCSLHTHNNQPLGSPAFLYHRESINNGCSFTGDQVNAFLMGTKPRDRSNLINNWIYRYNVILINEAFFNVTGIMLD